MPKSQKRSAVLSRGRRVAIKTGYSHTSRFIGPLRPGMAVPMARPRQLVNNNMGSSFTLEKPLNQKGQMPFAREYNVRLKYTHFTGITANGINTFAGINFSLNSLFDPDFTGVGHQPYMYDSLVAAGYSKYIVTGVKISAEWSNPSVDGMYCAMKLLSVANATPGNIFGKNIEYVTEQRDKKLDVLNNSGSQKKVQSVYVSLARLESITKQQLLSRESEFGALVTTSPSAVNFLQLAVTDSNALGAGNVAVNLTLTYYAKMYGWQTQPQS